MIIPLVAALLLAQAPPAPGPTPGAPAAPGPAATPGPSGTPGPSATPSAPGKPPGAANKATATPRPPTPPAVTPPTPPAPRVPGSDEPDREPPVLSGFDTPTGKKFTGEFKDRPVGDALRQVAKSAGLSIVLPAGLYGTVNADFNAAPVEDVLLVLLEQNELRGERKGSILTITRGTSGSVVIRGGKRRIEFGTGQDRYRIQIDPDEIRREAERAARDVEREVRQAEREMRQAEKEMRDAEAEHAEALDEPADGPDDDGDSGQDRVVSGDQIVKAGERVNELVVLRGNVRLEAGSRAQQVTAVMGSVDIGPGVQVEREVVAVGGDVHVSSGAYIGGDVVSVGGKLVLDEGARIDGQQTAVDVPGLGGLLSIAGSRPWSAPEAPLPIRIGHAIAQFAMFLALGLLLLVVTPRRVEVVGRSLTNSPGKALLTGFLGTLALPVLALLLIVTIVGIPLVAVLVLAIVAATVLGFTSLAQLLGERLPLGTRGGQVLRLAVGTALLIAATKVPVLGVLVWIAGWLFIFGAVLRTRFGQQPVAVPAAPIPPPFPPAPPSAPPPAPPPATSPPVAP